MDSNINKLIKHIDLAEKSNANVSSSSIGWHIAHSLLVIIKIGQALKNSEEKDYNPTFSKQKLFVFLFGKFPRGKAKAPEAVKPIQFYEDDINQLYEEALMASNVIKQANKNQFFNHPMFGHLNKKSTIRFLQIHSNHHISIINDILQNHV